MTDDFEPIPTIGFHRGVGLHDCQSPERLQTVRSAIDDVFDEQDLDRLFEIAGDPNWPPESRLLAAAKLEAAHQIATEERRVRPSIDLVDIHAAVAGLRSQKWRHPHCYASLLDAGPRPGETWPQREQPLP